MNRCCYKADGLVEHQLSAPMCHLDPHLRQCCLSMNACQHPSVLGDGLLEPGIRAHSTAVAQGSDVSADRGLVAGVCNQRQEYSVEAP